MPLRVARAALKQVAPEVGGAAVPLDPALREPPALVVAGAAFRVLGQRVRWVAEAYAGEVGGGERLGARGARLGRVSAVVRH